VVNAIGAVLGESRGGESKNKGKQTNSERHARPGAQSNPSESWLKEFGHELPKWDKCTRSAVKRF
jgi:hypothetical protein